MPLMSSLPRVLAASLVCALAAGPAAAETLLSPLAGNWSGGGQVRLLDGRSERLSCRATYRPSASGTNLGFSIRCASQSYKIELRSSLQYAGGRLSGTWEEVSYNAGGQMSGKASAGSLSLSFSGTLTGSMSVSFGERSQRVAINTDGAGGLSSVSLSLSKA
jgi:hypothetical protein